MSKFSTRASPMADEVVIFQPEFVEFGGEERVILALSEGLHAADLPHRVVCYRDHIGLARYAREPLLVQALNPSATPGSKVLALRRLLLRMATMDAPIPMLFNIQSALHVGLANLMGGLRYQLRIPDTYSLLIAPAVDDIRDTRVASWLRNKITEIGIRGADKLYTNTTALADEMELLYRRRAQVLYLGGLGEGVASLASRDKARIHLLSVSRLQESKRIDWMLRALASMRDAADLPPWQLHVVGSGPERQALEALSLKLGLEGRVVFHGFIDDATLKHLYKQSHVFLMPARQGYGLPAIEALQHRCAVVMNSESGVAEVLQNSSWVAIAAPGEIAYHNSLREMLLRVSTPGFFDQQPPVLPSMQSWATQLIAHAGW